MHGHPHQKHHAMKEFKEGYHEKDLKELATCDLKYAKSEMGNPEELKESVEHLASYVKKHKMQY